MYSQGTFCPFTKKCRRCFAISKVAFFFVFILLFASVALPLDMQLNNKAKIENIKQMLNLSAKVLINNIDSENLKLIDVSLGSTIPKNVEISVNKDKLLNDFFDTVYKNLNNTEIFESIKMS